MPIAGNPRNLVRLSVAVLIGLAVAALPACDAQPGGGAAGSGARQVTVVGSGTVDGTPDTLTTNVAISFTAPDATTALNQTNERQQAVIDALVGTGVDREDISTTQVSLAPQYGGSDGGNAVAGYQASNAIDVRLRDTSAASRLLALITSIGGDATRINSVAYSIDDDSQLVTDARARAFDDAKDRAQQYADLSELTLGNVISISETTESSTPPPPAPAGPMPRGMVADVPLSPGKQSVNFSVTVVWELT